MLSHAYELVDANRSRELLTRLFHTVSFGELAVDGFFILSGYLIVGSYIQKPLPIRFLYHRILRIFPGFLACAFICMMIVGKIGGGHDFYSRIDLKAFALGLPFLTLDGTPPVFRSLAVPVLNGSLWSLNPEFQCYLLSLICGLAGVLRRPLLWLSLGVLFATLFSAHNAGVTVILVGRTHDFYRVIYRMGMFFAAGGWVAMKEKSIPFTAPMALASFVALCVCLTSRPLAEPGVAIFGTYCLLWIGLKTSPSIAFFNRLPDVSYGTYLYGWPIAQLVLLATGHIHPLLLLTISLPLAWIAGAASWYAIEKPFLSFRSLKLQPRRRKHCRQSKP